MTVAVSALLKIQRRHLEPLGFCKLAALVQYVRKMVLRVVISGTPVSMNLAPHQQARPRELLGLGIAPLLTPERDADCR